MSKKLGRMIAYYRGLNDINQMDLGEKLGVSAKTISSWEVGRTEPRIDKIKEMSALFHCSESDLIGGEKIETTIELESEWVAKGYLEKIYELLERDDVKNNRLVLKLTYEFLINILR